MGEGLGIYTLEKLIECNDRLFDYLFTLTIIIVCNIQIRFYSLVRVLE